MARRVLLSTRTQRWLHREVAYLAERSVPAARRLLGRIEDARRRLAAFPRSGRPGLVPGSRRLVVGSYVLTYRERGADLEIIDIRHGRQAEPATSPTEPEPC
jgi:plasmid stabilization system protein ParE